MTTLTLADLAARFELALHGDGATAIHGLCALKPGETGKLAFLASPQHRAYLPTTLASAVIVGPRDVAALVTPALVARDPNLAFARIAKLFDRSQAFEPSIHPDALIDPTAEIGIGCRIEARVVIGAGAVIGAGSRIGVGCVIQTRVKLGESARLEPGVTLCEGVTIGARLLAQPGAVIGSRGFGNVRLPDGRWEEMPQLGSVVIGDDVEVGANTTIDRGALGDTVIGDGAKLDNQIQIAHNCVIGAHTAIAGSAGIAGSTTVGARCMIGGAVNIGGHLHICDDVVLLGRAMVTGHITQPGIYGSGLPFAPAAEWRKTVARVRRLDTLQTRIRRLEQVHRLPSSTRTDSDPEADDPENKA